MFVALRDIAFAKGRFALIAAVVFLITLLVGLLSGLTAGLANQNIQAVTSIGAYRIVLQTPAKDQQPSYSESVLTEKQVDEWKNQSGVKSAEPIGIGRAHLASGSKTADVATFGVESTFGRNAPADDRLTLTKTTADALGVKAGDDVTLGSQKVEVDKVVDDQFFSHQAVTYLPLTMWQNVQKQQGQSGYASVIAIKGDPKGSVAGTTNDSVLSSLTAIGSFRSEIGSLLLMVGMLFGISALVVGAFFTVWSLQRRGDVAVLKALGASTSSLVKDSLAQTTLILIIGIGAGIGLTALFGALMGNALPFVLSPLTTLVPGIALVITGVIGALFALRSVVKADPLTALGAAR